MIAPHSTAVCIAGFITVFALAAPAWGAGADTGQATAAALFDEAKRLASAGDFEHACPKFVEAQRLVPTAGTLLNTGNCYEKLGKLASAWGAFKEAEIMARNLNDADREQEAIRRAQAIAPQLAKVAIEVPSAARAPGFELRRDGVVIGEGQWGTALPVDAGTHMIEASATGRRAWRTTVTIEPTPGVVTVRVPVLVLDASAEPKQALGPFWNAQRIAGASVAGIGLVGLAMGAAFGAKALSQKSDANANCRPQDPNLCNARGVALHDDALTSAHVSTAGLVVGGAALAAGVTVFLIAARAKQAPAAARFDAVPILGPSAAGLTIRMTW